MWVDIVQHEWDAFRLGKVNVYEFLHAGCGVNGGTAVGDFHLAPGPMHIKEDKQIGGAIALVLTIIADAQIAALRSESPNWNWSQNGRVAALIGDDHDRISINITVLID